MSKPAFKRILLKLSGESFLQKEASDGFLLKLANSLKEVQSLDVEIAMVVGAGNLLRGAHSTIERAKADHIGMLSTVINGLVLLDILGKSSIKAKILSSFNCGFFIEGYSFDKARKLLEEKNIVILVGGTGSCYLTTDTASAIRALELNASLFLKGTKVDGVYDKDPIKDRSAKKLEHLSYNFYLNNHLRVMDSCAVALCQENNLPICIFDLFEEKNLKKAILGEKVGSLISGENYDRSK